MSFWTKRRFPSIPSKPISLKSSLGPSSPLSIFLDHTFLATSFLIQTSGHRFKTQLPHECRSTKHTVTGTHFAFHSQTLNQPRPSLLKRQKTKDKRQKTKDQASHFGCLVIRCCITIRVFEHQRCLPSDSLFRSNQTFSFFNPFIKKL